ncbi:hypothetical protein EDC04DRAFT_2515413, partial [Pisolithus marmoratus]
VSDLEGVKRRMPLHISESDRTFQQAEDEDENNTPPPQDIDPTTATILQTGRLCFRNLAFPCTDTELRGPLQSFGEIEQ